MKAVAALIESNYDKLGGRPRSTKVPQAEDSPPAPLVELGSPSLPSRQGRPQQTLPSSTVHSSEERFLDLSHRSAPGNPDISLSVPRKAIARLLWLEETPATLIESSSLSPRRTRCYRSLQASKLDRLISWPRLKDTWRPPARRKSPFSDNSTTPIHLMRKPANLWEMSTIS